MGIGENDEAPRFTASGDFTTRTMHIPKYPESDDLAHFGKSNFNGNGTIYMLIRIDLMITAIHIEYTYSSPTFYVIFQ